MGHRMTQLMEILVLLQQYYCSQCISNWLTGAVSTLLHNTTLILHYYFYGVFISVKIFVYFGIFSIKIHVGQIFLSHISSVPPHLAFCERSQHFIAHFKNKFIKFKSVYYLKRLYHYIIKNYIIGLCEVYA